MEEPVTGDMFHGHRLLHKRLKEKISSDKKMEPNTVLDSILKKTINNELLPYCLRKDVGFEHLYCDRQQEDTKYLPQTTQCLL